MKKKYLYIGIVLVISYAIFLGKETVMTIKKILKGDSWDKMIPDMQIAVQSTIDDANEQGLSVQFFEGYRTKEKEQEYIDKGTSKLSDPDNSDHRYGIGADIVFSNAVGGYSWEATNEEWVSLHTIGAKHGLDFYISWDKAHCRLAGYKLADLRKEYGTPENFLIDNGVNV